MFGIGMPELLLVAVAGLLILGPKRLPEALRTLGLWQRRITSSYRTMRWELEREIDTEPDAEPEHTIKAPD